MPKSKDNAKLTDNNNDEEFAPPQQESVAAALKGRVVLQSMHATGLRRRLDHLRIRREVVATSTSPRLFSFPVLPPEEDGRRGRGESRTRTAPVISADSELLKHSNNRKRVVLGSVTSTVACNASAYLFRNRYGLVMMPFSGLKELRKE